MHLTAFVMDRLSPLSARPHQMVQRHIRQYPERTMTEPGKHPDGQGDLLRPLARETNGHDRALIEETLAAVRDIRDQLREPAADHGESILASLRHLESRLDALPESLSDQLRRTMEECLAAVRETNPAAPADDAALEREVAGTRAETAIYMAERKLMGRFDEHDDHMVRLDGKIGGDIENIQKTLRNIANGISRVDSSISSNRWQRRFVLSLFTVMLVGLFLAGMLAESRFHLIQGLL